MFACTAMILLLELSLHSPASAQEYPDIGADAVDSVQKSDDTLFGFDSLRLSILETEMAKARLKSRQTNLWHRLLPQVHVSASFGMKDVVFVAPDNFMPYVLPKDAYRLTLSLSLNEVFDFDKHSNAELDLQRLVNEYETAKLKVHLSHEILQQQLNGIDTLMQLTEKELQMKQGILSFDSLLFHQGKLEFDAYIKSKLDLLGITKRLVQFRQDRDALLIKLKMGLMP